MRVSKSSAVLSLLLLVSCAGGGSGDDADQSRGAGGDAVGGGGATGGAENHAPRGTGGGGLGGGSAATGDAAQGGGDGGSGGAAGQGDDAGVGGDSGGGGATAVDASVGDADGSVPTGGGGGNKTVALVWGYGEHKPTPKPTDTPMPLDRTMKMRLEARGYKVELLEDAVSTVAAVKDKALLVISSSINRTNLFDGGQPRFKDLAVPTIVMKDGTIEVMGLGTGSAGGFSTGVGETEISIVAPADPLAAGLMGNVAVYTKGDRLIWANPGPAAKKIATVVGNPNQVTIFAYLSGAMMVNGAVAPAKRMGFFIHRNTDYNDNGLKLFDAAVDYLVAP
jgi:hypothetical protein